MKIYKIWQSSNNTYDTYDSAIVAAKNEEEARKICPDANHQWENGYWFFLYADGSKVRRSATSWVDSLELVSVEYVGNAKEGTQSGVILASFNAG